MGTGMPHGTRTEPKADAGGGTQTSSWQAPTDVEQALYDAKSRDDWPAYFDALADTWLYYATPRYPLDAVGERSYTPYWNERTGTFCVPLLTAGVLPAPVGDPVYVSNSLNSHAAAWPDDDWWLAVNPGTPCEAYFPATMAHRAVWRQHFERSWRDKHSTLRTLRVGAPLHGPVAHGLACCALMFVNNGQLWNSIAHHGTGYDDEKYLLKKWWGVTDRAKWQDCTEQLLRGDMVSPRWEFVLRVRDTLHQNSTVSTSGGALPWREVTDGLARERMTQLDADSAGMDEIAFDTDAEVEDLQQIIGRIMRYESRFRADGLLDEDAYVRSALAWDYGRASGMARWGQGARLCELRETEQAVLRAGRVSQTAYDSWEEFSAGYILGRCLHFDEEKFGDWYEDMLKAHHILTSDPASPWLNIPFK
jgi:hypothetical protein